jgi:dTDP-4-dehydrorhamnose reductase
MRLLVVGAAGQVGRELVEQGRADGHEVLATYNSRVPAIAGVAAIPLDKTDRARADQIVREFRAEAVVDTGALHNVDYCEDHPEEALRVNRDGTRNLADAARAVGARFVFVSTDFVFDGRKVGPYVESDRPRPESRYAESKLAGEEATLAASPTNLVVRPSVIYSWLDSRFRAASSSGKGMNFGTWLVEEVARGRSVRIIDDQVASPTMAGDLAGAILALLRKKATGLYHTAGASPVTRYEFSKRLVQRLSLDTRLVQPVRTADLKQKARRPVNSSLNSDRLAADTDYRMLALEPALDRFAAAFDQDPGAPRPGA